ncbi:hypothetical protein NDR87_01440 [Nocardia sp. CDC159]|uniref:Uncharacterized protein n=1 Tax=Nocardia pulmonis TaxID=2951408 RepID=A0A9X2E2C1_9NOCA|nr:MULTISPECIES: hypothetical protein [Nocardia]MCM6772326.1 hypothetical protein [Nocardia pulmonis]MCM6785016.1 hypothetical protein [Nocardia sp. CDC159]
MTSDRVGVLATRRLSVGGSDVLVTIGAPRRRGSAADSPYCCQIDIEGLGTELVRLQAISPSLGQTVAIALSAVTQRLHVEATDFLADARLGSPGRTSDS